MLPNGCTALGAGMLVKALFITQEGAFDAAFLAAGTHPLFKSATEVSAEARRVYRRGELKGYNAWFILDGHRFPVLEEA